MRLYLIWLSSLFGCLGDDRKTIMKGEQLFICNVHTEESLTKIMVYTRAHKQTDKKIGSTLHSPPLPHFAFLGKLAQRDSCSPFITFLFYLLDSLVSLYVHIRTRQGPIWRADPTQYFGSPPPVLSYSGRMRCANLDFCFGYSTLWNVVAADAANYWDLSDVAHRVILCISTNCSLVLLAFRRKRLRRILAVKDRSWFEKEFMPGNLESLCVGVKVVDWVCCCCCCSLLVHRIPPGPLAP